MTRFGLLLAMLFAIAGCAVKPPPAVPVAEMCRFVRYNLEVAIPDSLGAQERIALFTFRRPPLTVLDASEATASTLLSRVVFSAAVVRLQAERTSRAAPATCGVAIDVPLKYP